MHIDHYGIQTFEADAYDPIKDTWTEPIDGDAAVSVGDSSYVLGVKAAVFNIKTQAWSFLPAPPTRRYGLAGSTDGAGHAFAIGGYDAESERCLRIFGRRALVELALRSFWMANPPR